MDAGVVPARLSADDTELLSRLLFEARSWGFLGPGPVEPHIAHALGFADALAAVPARWADLGSGGGVPGLVLAQLWPDTDAVLLDANQRRCDFLASVAGQLRRPHPPEVVRGRAEELGRLPALRGTFDAVVARGFGPPGVTAECASPFVRVGGSVVVSEPPEDANRWDVTKLAVLGLRLARRQATKAGAFQVLEQATACPTKFPRRVGKPGKRPLF